MPPQLLPSNLLTFASVLSLSFVPLATSRPTTEPQPPFKLTQRDPPTTLPADHSLPFAFAFPNIHPRTPTPTPDSDPDPPLTYVPIDPTSTSSTSSSGKSHSSIPFDSPDTRIVSAYSICPAPAPAPAQEGKRPKQVALCCPPQAQAGGLLCVSFTKCRPGDVLSCCTLVEDQDGDGIGGGGETGLEVTQGYRDCEIVRRSTLGLGSGSG